MVLRRFYITENVNGTQAMPLLIPILVYLTTGTYLSPCAEVEGEQSFEDGDSAECKTFRGKLNHI